MHKQIGLLLLAVLGVLLCTGLAGTPPAPLPKDPLITETVLPNGMHCIVRPNKTPPGQVSLWLHISAGSDDETNQERGLAHFLEHVAFDGSEHFPPGAMTDQLRKLGLTVGVHQNAYTSFNQTTFQINLPNATPDAIRTALLCLSDIAYRLTVPPSQLEKEKRIVLEELRARSGPQQRTMKETWSALFAGHELADRDPSGTEACIRSFTRAQVLDFYHRGYRPEKATLLIVGDIDAAQVTRSVPDYFSAWRSTRSPAPPAETIRCFAERQKIITDPELSTAKVSLYAIAPPRPLQTLADLREFLLAKLTDRMIQTRLTNLRQKGSAPFQEAALFSDNYMNYANIRNLTVTGDPQKWQAMLNLLVTECHRAELYGFSGQETADAKAALLAEEKSLAETLETRDTRWLITSLNEAISERSQLVSDVQVLRLAEQILPTITPADLTAQFTTSFDPVRWLAVITLPGGSRSPSAAQVQEVVADARRAPLAPLEPTRPPGKILEHDPLPPPASSMLVQKDPDLGITRATLRNNVVVNQRPMSSSRNTLLLTLTVPGGEIEENATNRGLTQLVAACLNQTATSRLDSVEMRRILSSTNIRFYAEADPDALTLNLVTSPQNLEDAFRLLHALLTSARLEPSAVDNWRLSMQQEKVSQKSDVSAALMWTLRQEIYCGDDRHVPVPVKNIADLPWKAAQDWADLLLRQRPLELGLAGDVPSSALDLANKYLGSLPTRPVMKDLFASDRRLAIKPGAVFATTEINTVTDKAMVSIGFRGASIRELEANHGLQILGRIVQNRLREKIREEKGLTYSADIFNQPGDAYPAGGIFLVYLTCDPARAPETVRLCQEIIDEIAQNGFTPGELEIATKEYLNVAKLRDVDANYWVDRLSRLNYTGWDPAWSRNDPDRIARSATMLQIRAIAAKYFVPSRRITVICSPRPKADDEAAPPNA